MARSTATSVLPHSELAGQFGGQRVREEPFGRFSRDVSCGLKAVIGKPIASELLDDLGCFSTVSA
jgi:hypothetical protein